MFVVRIHGIDFGLESFPLIGRCSTSCAMLMSQKFRDLCVKTMERLAASLVHFCSMSFIPVSSHSMVYLPYLYLIVLIPHHYYGVKIQLHYDIVVNCDVIYSTKLVLVIW